MTINKQHFFKVDNNMKDNMPALDPLGMMPFGQVDPRIYSHKPAIHMHDLYLVGPIESAEKYLQWFELIRTARPNDQITIHINSPGGDLYTMLQFMRCMRESKATIIGSIEGACMSAATMLFLECDSWQVTDHSSFMIHDYSSLTYGKGSEQKKQIEFETPWSERLFTDIYRDFLTPEEIASVLSGIDIWMGSEEVIERLKKKTEAEAQEETEEVPDFEKMTKAEVIKWTVENLGEIPTITNKMTKAAILQEVLKLIDG